MEAPQTMSTKLLPANAYTKLAPGEEYRPIVATGVLRAEVTPWSVGVGLAMVVIFTAACVYIALRAGNGIEASIPIAILAIFFGMMKKVKSTILENVMVQSIGQASGVVAAGATFVVPALYINQLPAAWWQIFLACSIGGILGVVLIIPLRKYFVKDLHGDLPFPEATAINEVLITGESSAGGAGKILIMAFFLGAGYDFLVEGFHLWNPSISTSAILGSVGDAMAGIRFEIQIAGLAALFGLGYIIGVKYASIIASGSVLAMLVMVPVVYLFGKSTGSFDYAGQTFDIANMSAGAIFSNFVKPIGIGAIAVSGLIGIMRMGNIVVGSVSLGFKGLSKSGRSQAQSERVQLDMEPKNVLLIQLFSILAMAALFFVVALLEGYSTGDAALFALVGTVAGFLLSFLFTPVAAQAIAIVGVNPVSGMTLITVVLAIGAMIMVGLAGKAGMIIALVVGTAVCTALSTSGALISDFKVGYWIGATPRNQQRWKFLGIIVAALVVALVIPLMDSAYHFLVKDPATGALISNEKMLPAPQANMIAAVSRGLMDDPAAQPWLLYGLGGIVAIMLFMSGVPMLAFALGMYLPISINAAVLAGATCAWIIGKTGGSEEVRKARTGQGILIASGMMAGAAIFGILTAVMRLPKLGALIQYISVGVDYQVVDGSLKDTPSHWFEGGTGQLISLGMLVALSFACYLLASLGAKWQLAAELEAEVMGGDLPQG
jgi:putative OPT family oligopeptide transporter